MNKNKKDKIKTHTATETKTDFSDKTVKELIEICKDKTLKDIAVKKRGYFKLVVRQVQHTKRCCRNPAEVRFGK
jgi:hypothetical protein